MLNNINIVVVLEGTSYVSNSDYIISSFENNARTFTVDFSNVDFDLTGFTKSALVSNSINETYKIDLDSNNSFELTDDILTNGRLYIQIQLLKDDVIIRDNTLLVFNVKNSINLSEAIDNNATLTAQIQTHLEDDSIHFEDADADGVIYGRQDNDWVAVGGSTAVISVNGETGAVILDTDDIAEGSTNLYFVDAPSDGSTYGRNNGAWAVVTGGGAVDSVNGQTGIVILDADDIDDTSTVNKFTTVGDISKLAGIEDGAEVNVVDSVNGQIGVIELDKTDIGLSNVQNVDTTNADNITDGTTNAIITLTQEVNFESAYSHTSLTNNPHLVTAEQVGLGNVDNTSDLNKPISTATQNALDLKADESITVNGQALSSNVVLDSDDISEGSTNLYLTGNEFQKNVDTMDNITNGTTYVKTTNDYTSAEKTKLAGITTGADLTSSSNETITGNWNFTGNANVYSEQLTSKSNTGDEYLKLVRVQTNGGYNRMNVRFNVAHTGSFVKYGMVTGYIYKITGQGSLHSTSFVYGINDSGSGLNFSSGDIVYVNYTASTGTRGYTDIYVKIQEYAKLHSTLDFAYSENGAILTIDPDSGVRVASIPTTGTTFVEDSVTYTSESPVNATIKTITMT